MNVEDKEKIKELAVEYARKVAQMLLNAREEVFFDDALLKHFEDGVLYEDEEGWIITVAATINLKKQWHFSIILSGEENK